MRIICRFRCCLIEQITNFSIVRLELLSCLLLSKRITMVIKAVEVKVKVNKLLCCSDLHIAIWWICQIGKKWKCWIQNRIDTIRECCGKKSALCVHSTSWKFSQHFVFVFRTDWNVLIKFYSSDSSFNRHILRSIYLKFKTYAHTHLAITHY